MLVQSLEEWGGLTSVEASSHLNNCLLGKLHQAVAIKISKQVRNNTLTESDWSAVEVT